MEKPSQDQQQQQPLKCPRCDSSNTKFCYYNNYSLSQPRHFCKACKRYWTRGGTLRNVPVGGGFRKNKKIKKPNITTTAAATNLSHNFHQPQNHINPLFYGLPTNYSRVSNNISGLGFSSGLMMGTCENGVKSIIQDNPMFGSSSTCSPSSTFASLLAFSSQQHKFNNFQDLSTPYNNGMILKGVKMDGESQNRLNWNEEMINSGDPSISWLDPSSNSGSSVPSLI